MKRIISIVIIILALTGFVSAQFGPDFKKGECKERLRERIEMIRMWKLVETLNLSEEQSVEFFPIFNVCKKI